MKTRRCARRCDGVLRRDMLRVGGLTAMGMGLADFLHLRRASASPTAPAPKAKACILIWLDGGPSHLETFDPKPQAPEEVRGPMGTIATSLPGVRLGELMPQTAKIMDKLSVIRSMTSPLGEHNFGTHYLMTGYKPTPAVAYPTFGATLAKVRPPSGVLPPYIAVPRFTRNIRSNGFLPGSTRAFDVGGNPGRPDFQVRDLDFYEGLNLKRLARRQQMVKDFDAFARHGEATIETQSDPDLQRAFDLIASPTAKQAFDLSQEPEKLRRRYGRDGGNSIGQSCLLARRLVQRGVPFVTVHNSGWDTHEDIMRLKERFPSDKNGPVPALDRALGALVGDLDERGMLDETLVIVMGEFGRTPKINSRGGRDHWPNVFSVAMAGGGVRGGNVLGSSDALGELPKDDPVTPADLAATIYTLLGIDPALELRTDDGRPIRVAPDGSRVVTELLA